MTERALGLEEREHAIEHDTRGATERWEERR
jgi:hypothetical protein